MISVIILVTMVIFAVLCLIPKTLLFVFLAIESREDKAAFFFVASDIFFKILLCAICILSTIMYMKS